MAETDAEQEARQAKRKRIRRIKLLIFVVPLFSITILLGLCIFLGIRLHMVKKELRDMRAAIEATTVIDQTDSADNTNDADTDTEPALYTVSEVDEFKQTGNAEEAVSEEDSSVRKVYLTFDDGPSSNTNRILDILADYDVKATFFVVGKEEEEYQALYNRIVEEGHTLAMHSYSHKYNEIYQSVESFSTDLSKLQEFLYDTTGVWCRYCRFPGGSSNTVSRVDMHELIDYLEDQDMSYFDWNISSGDAASAYISSADIIRNCTVNLRDYDEAIILMHDASNKNSTVEALPGLIETIQAMEDTKILPITDDTERIHHISND
ncbi:MAG: polysaccharide deacetylase [Lachnospiraceae bacterium]|nr:polysaccharide deacetylase [Lachnospiraceae bacterium]